MKQLLRPLLIVMGLVLLLVGLAPLAQPAFAQELPPRPPVAPPPVDPPPAQDSEQPAPLPFVPGRITGTVIDLTTGAPTPGVTVQIGAITVTSDANGNYDRNNLPPGTYTITLLPTAAQGESAQGPVSVELASNQTLVQHLAFRSPLAPTPIPAVVAPVEPVLVDTPAPPVPVSLPVTAGEGRGSFGLIALGVLLLGFGYGMRRVRG